MTDARQEHTTEVKVLILFFSGTGNTQFIAEYIRDRIAGAGDAAGAEITLAALEWVSPQIVTEHDVLCLGFPVYEGCAPRVVREFLAALPAVTNRGAFVFNTKGLAQGTANRQTVRALEGKGFRPLGCASVVMPASDGISMFTSKDSPRFRRYLERNFSSIPEADRLAGAITRAARHLAARGRLADLPRDSAFAPFGFLVTGIFRLLYATLGESAAGKLHVTDECTLCGRCERICPMANITVNSETVTFDGTCVFCLRCINNCPAEAVQVGKLSVNKARWHGPGGGYKPLKYRTPRRVHASTTPDK